MEVFGTLGNEAIFHLKFDPVLAFRVISFPPPLQLKVEPVVSPCAIWKQVKAPK